MEELEQQTQKHVVSFCKILPVHVERWRNIIQEFQVPLKVLGNFADQLRHIEKANIKHMDNFNELQQKMQFKILTEIEEEMKNIKDLIDQLNNVNHDLKNKLSLLERSTIPLDWERNSSLINGTAVQPPLSRILQDGLEFFTYFSTLTKTINENYKLFDVRKEKTVQKLEECFKIDFNDSRINSLLAVTQYVDNEKSIT